MLQLSGDEREVYLWSTKCSSGDGAFAERLTPAITGPEGELQQLILLD